MYDVDLARAIVQQIDRALQTIRRRFAPVTSPDDLSASDAGLEKLDAICMQLIALGENVKNLEKVTGGKLLTQYPQIEWKKVMGMRDVISHHYFDLDAEIVYAVCKDRIPEISVVVQQMLMDFSTSKDG